MLIFLIQGCLYFTNVDCDVDAIRTGTRCFIGSPRFSLLTSCMQAPRLSRHAFCLVQKLAQSRAALTFHIRRIYDKILGA